MTLKCNFKTQVVWFLISENNIIIYFMVIDQNKYIILWSLVSLSQNATSSTHFFASNE